MIADTSREAYEKLLFSRKLTGDQQRVFDCIKSLGEACNDQIAERTGLLLSTVCGRVNDLKRFKVIGFERKGLNSRGNSVNYWSVRDVNDKELEEIANEDDEPNAVRLFDCD